MNSSHRVSQFVLEEARDGWKWWIAFFTWGFAAGMAVMIYV